MNLETESFYLAPGIIYSKHFGQEQLELSLLITLATIFLQKRTIWLISTNVLPEALKFD